MNSTVKHKQNTLESGDECPSSPITTYLLSYGTSFCTIDRKCQGCFYPVFAPFFKDMLRRSYDEIIKCKTARLGHVQRWDYMLAPNFLGSLLVSTKPGLRG